MRFTLIHPRPQYIIILQSLLLETIQWLNALAPQPKAVKFSQPKAFNSELTVVIFNTMIYYSLLFSARTTKGPTAMWFVASVYTI